VKRVESAYAAETLALKRQAEAMNLFVEAFAKMYAIIDAEKRKVQPPSITDQINFVKEVVKAVKELNEDLKDMSGESGAKEIVKSLPDLVGAAGTFMSAMRGGAGKVAPATSPGVEKLRQALKEEEGEEGGQE